MDLIALLRTAVERGASDIHLKLGQPPVVRLDGDLEQMEDMPAMSEMDLDEILDAVTMISPRRRDAFDDTGDLDIAYSNPTLPRFRVNGFRQRGAISFAFRVIPSEIPNFTRLGLPAGVTRLVTYAYDMRGNLVIPDYYAENYDGKVCPLRTNTIFQFIHRNYSQNNPVAATRYNSKGLPLDMMTYRNGLFYGGETTAITYDCP